MHLLWNLFYSFFLVGLLTFGGGYSMLPMLEREVLKKHGWCTQEELLEYFAVSQALPGLVAINTAILVGYKKRRVLGAAATAFGVVLPSLLIILLIAAALQQFMHLPVVMHAFAGIRVAAAALIAAAVLRLLRSNVLPKRTKGEAGAGLLKHAALPLVLCAAAFVCVAVLGASPVWVVLGAIAVGLLLCRRGEEHA